MELLNSSQAAEFLGIPRASFKQHVHRGRLVPDATLNGRDHLWKRETLIASGIPPRRGERGREPLLTPEQIADARARREAGEEAAAIAQEFGVPVHVLYYRTGALKSKRPTLTEKQKNQVNALAKQGVAQKEIAARLEITAQQVWRALNANGMKKAKNSP